MTTALNGDHLIQLLLALILLSQAGKAINWFIRRPDAQQEAEAKEATRRAIAEALNSLRDTMQISKEARAIAHETRELVRGLEKTHIISAETDKQMLAVLTKLEAAFTGVATSISELVGELRSSRTAK
jgi:hypothetical protein